MTKLFMDREQDIILKRCETAAIKFLVKREYSEFELQQKLKLYSYTEAVIEQVLFKLKEQKLQSDERFAACYARSLIERGFGPIKIKYELKNRGISADIIVQILAEYKEDWLKLAEKVRKKKFGALVPNSFEEKAKQNKFLLYKGFDVMLF